MRRERVSLLALILVLSLVSCFPTFRGIMLGNSAVGARVEPEMGQHATLVVFAAASLHDAFGKIGAEFEHQHPMVQVEFNYAGSQQLAQQLAQGAPADVFASADQRQMQAAVEAGRIEVVSVRAFAGNQLTLVFPADNPAGLSDWRSIAQPGLKLALAAEEVPIGRYTQEFIEKVASHPDYGVQFKQAVLANVITYDENVRSVLSRVVLGEVDAGIVYVSDIQAAPVGKVAWLSIPDDFNVTAGYYIAPLENSSQSVLAAAFIDFICSPAGQEILQQYGFSSQQSIHLEIAN